MPQIPFARLQKIIKEELKRYYLAEGEQDTIAVQHALSATKCLAAIEKYKETATEAAKTALGTNLEEVEKILKRIAASPMNYADMVPEEGDEEGLESLSSAPTSVKKASPKVTVKSSDSEDLL